MTTEVKFTTMKNVLYVEGKNDLYKSTVPQDDLFKQKAIPILTPEFFVIYTGTEEWNQTELRLSNSYVGKPKENSLELVVKIIDVRYNKKEAEGILARSEKLRGYSLLLEYVREYKREGYALETAIDLAVDRCIEEDILKDFLIKYGKEVRGMLYDDMNMEQFAQIRGEEKWEEGRAEGIRQGRAEGEDRLNKLYEILFEQNEHEKMQKAMKDSSYRAKLFEEYSL